MFICDKLLGSPHVAVLQNNRRIDKFQARKPGKQMQHISQVEHIMQFSGSSCPPQKDSISVGRLLQISVISADVTHLPAAAPQATCGTCASSGTLTKTMIISASMSVTQVRGKYKCTARITVQDADLKPLGKDILVTGRWSKVPDNKVPWAYSASARTAASSVAPIAAKTTFPKTTATTCTFTTSAVDASAFAAARLAKNAVRTAGNVSAKEVVQYVVDWQRSKAVAKGCWTASGVIMSNCP